MLKSEGSSALFLHEPKADTPSPRSIRIQNSTFTIHHWSAATPNQRPNGSLALQDQELRIFNAMSKPIFHLIGGPNGAGKTTFAREFLPHEVGCLKFLNSDEIAKGLSPFDTAAGQLQAGRILLENLKRHIENEESFALESTLSGKTYIKYLQKAQQAGYEIYLYFLWLPSAEESYQRVLGRVLEGGHSVSQADVFRRYPRIMKLIFDDYLPMADQWQFLDASKLPMELVAKSSTMSIEDLKERYEESM